MMIAIALVFSYVETLIPINFGIPGVKLGLANLAIVAVLYIMGGKQALFVSVVRIVLSGFLFANLASILSGGRVIESCHHGSAAEDKEIPGRCSQRYRRHLPQCGTADRRHVCSGKPEPDGISAGIADRRIPYRTADRHRVSAGVAICQKSIYGFLNIRKGFGCKVHRP